MTKKKWIHQGSGLLSLIALLWFVPAISAHAASLYLVSKYPDIYSTNTINYDYTAITCYNSTGGTGTCGTGGGGPGGYKLSNGVATGSGVFTLAGTPLTIDMESGGPAPLSITGTRTYSLTANFSTVGGVTSFASGSLGVTGTVAGFGSTNILTATLADNLEAVGAFGFAGYNAAGLFEFTFNVTGGELFALGYDIGGVIVNTGSLCNGLLGSGSYTSGVCNLLYSSGTWDNTTGQKFMTKDFSASMNTSADTYVPVPAAVWLFGSGLLGLLGFAGRRA